MLRVTKQDGLIIWHDYFVNNPRNPDVRGVKKSEIYALFPSCRINLRRIYLSAALGALDCPSFVVPGIPFGGNPVPVYALCWGDSKKEVNKIFN